MAGLKVQIERCPCCHDRPFTVEYDDLVDAFGFIECENCGTELLSVDRSISQSIIASQSKEEFIGNDRSDAVELEQLIGAF